MQDRVRTSFETTTVLAHISHCAAMQSSSQDMLCAADALLRRVETMQDRVRTSLDTLCADATTVLALISHCAATHARAARASVRSASKHLNDCADAANVHSKQLGTMRWAVLRGFAAPSAPIDMLGSVDLTAPFVQLVCTSDSATMDVSICQDAPAVACEFPVAYADRVPISICVRVINASHDWMQPQHFCVCASGADVRDFSATRVRACTWLLQCELERYGHCAESDTSVEVFVCDERVGTARVARKFCGALRETITLNAGITIQHNTVLAVSADSRLFAVFNPLAGERTVTVHDIVTDTLALRLHAISPEFAWQPAQMLFTESGTLVVYDWTNKFIHEFLMDGSILRAMFLTLGTERGMLRAHAAYASIPLHNFYISDALDVKDSIFAISNGRLAVRLASGWVYQLELKHGAKSANSAFFTQPGKAAAVLYSSDSSVLHVFRIMYDRIDEETGEFYGTCDMVTFDLSGSCVPWHRASISGTLHEKVVAAVHAGQVYWLRFSRHDVYAWTFCRDTGRFCALPGSPFKWNREMFTYPNAYSGLNWLHAWFSHGKLYALAPSTMCIFN